MKSETCFGKASGQPLAVYFDEFDALSAAEHAALTYERALLPYQCLKCEKWHLSPKERQTPSFKCNVCTAGNGDFKNSYQTKSIAQTRAKIIFNESGRKLKVYKCIHGNGWHLTKSGF